MKTRIKRQSSGIVLLTFLVFIQLISGMMVFTLSQSTLQRQMSFNYAESIKDRLFAYSLLKRFALNLVTNSQTIPAQGKDGNYSYQTKIKLLDIDPCQLIQGHPAEYNQLTLILHNASSTMATKAVIARPFNRTVSHCQNGKIRTIEAGIQSLVDWAFEHQ